MRVVVIHCPNLEILVNERPGADTKEDAEIRVTSRTICEYLKERYRLRSFRYDDLELELNRLSNFRFDYVNEKEARLAERLTNLENSKSGILESLTRNQRGYSNCRAAIWQLFLIKRYSPENPFKHLNKDVITLIAQLLYDTIGTSVWCN